jgi:lipooligosaccharide transport system permease protein
MNKFSRLVWLVWWRNVLSYQRFVVPTVIASLGEPMLYLVAMGIGLGSYMGLINGQPYVNFLAPGLLVSSAMFAATYECTFSAMMRMTVERVYDSIMITPVSVEEIIGGEILWGITRGVMSGTVILLILYVFGIAHEVRVIPYLFLLWLAEGFLFSSMAMIVTSFAPSFDFFTYYLDLFLMPMFFFSGVFFPLDKYPPVMIFIANLLPLTHAVAISRMVMSGNIAEWAVVGHLAFLVVPGIVFFYWALYQMKQRLVK